ncbi:response regulator [bacterium]|nr:response regulator [bacterium]
MSRVLIVDDEKNVLKTLSIGLKRHKYNVTSAKSGPEALKIMETNAFDFVVSDIRMSPMDGYTLASRIREIYPDVIIILMSAYGFNEEHPVHSSRLSYPRISKPFDVEDLINVLETEKKRGGKAVKNNSANKMILLLGESKAEQKVRHLLEAEGFSVRVAETGTKSMDVLKSGKYDVCLIDGNFLDTEGWKIVNMVDRYSPDKPVVLLTRHKYDRKKINSSDAGITVLDRRTFLSEKTWAVEQLDKIIRQN